MANHILARTPAAAISSIRADVSSLFLIPSTVPAAIITTTRAIYVTIIVMVDIPALFRNLTVPPVTSQNRIHIIADME